MIGLGFIGRLRAARRNPAARTAAMAASALRTRRSRRGMAIILGLAGLLSLLPTGTPPGFDEDHALRLADAEMAVTEPPYEITEQMARAETPPGIRIRKFAAARPQAAKNPAHAALKTPAALLGEGRALAAQGQTDAAITMLRQALQQDNQLEGGHAALAALVAGRDAPEAEALFQEALRRNPGDVDALNGLGVMRDQQGRSAEAQSLFLKALGAAPGDPVSKRNLENSLRRPGAVLGALITPARQPAPPPRTAQAPPSFWERPIVLQLAGLSSLLTIVGACVLIHQNGRASRINARILAVRSGMSRTDKAVAPNPTRRAMQMIATIGLGIMRSGVVSSQTVETLQRNLEGAGIRSRNAVSIFVGCKLMMLVATPFATWLLIHGRLSNIMLHNTIIVIAGIVGLLLPDFVVNAIRSRYGQSLERGLPDALDMLVMCAESGLSLEPAIARVGVEIQTAHPAIAMEFMLTANELQMSPDSHAVLLNLGERTKMANIKRVVATLAQTLQYGTPLAEALRVLSAELRQETLTAFEARAARLPVLLTVPMIMFILPSLFMIVGGPAILQVISSVRN